MAMIGFFRSPSCKPVARHKARAPALRRPLRVVSLLRGGIGSLHRIQPAPLVFSFTVKQAKETLLQVLG